MPDSTITSQLLEAGRHMLGISQSLGVLAQNQPYLDMARIIAQDRKEFSDDRAFNARLESRYSRASIDDFNTRYANPKKRMNEEQLATYLEEKKSGLERAAATLRAFGGLIIDVQSGNPRNIRSSLKDFQGMRRRYFRQEADSFNIATELQAALKLVGAEKSDFGYSMQYIARGEPNTPIPIANETIPGKLLPAVGDGITVVNAVLEEAQRIVGTQAGSPHAASAAGVRAQQQQR